MRRSTPGVFSSVEPHTPRVCGPRFRTISDDSRQCVPPPLPCRNQPPPIPPKHYLRRNNGFEFSKHRENVETLDYVYSSISDSNVSSCSSRNPPLPQSYATREFPQPSSTRLGIRSISPHSSGLNCGSKSMSARGPYETRTPKYPFSTYFPSPASEAIKGPCTCSLSTRGASKQSFNSSNQSPVWSKMPSAVVSHPENAHPKSTSSAAAAPSNRDLSLQEKKPVSADSRPWIKSRLSRTMSRFFRIKIPKRKSKSDALRSRSVYLTDIQDKCNTESSPKPEPSSLHAFPPQETINSSPVSLPSSPVLPISPSLPPRRGDMGYGSTKKTSASVASNSTDVIVSNGAGGVGGTSPPPNAVSCVHHVHHIHHVHHVHHHLHHMSPPTTTTLAAAAVMQSSQTVLPPPPPPHPVAHLPVSGDDETAAAALVMMLENAATLGETPTPPPPPLPPLNHSRHSVERRQSQVGTGGNPHTYSAYGVRGGATGAPAGRLTCCTLDSMSPPPQPLAPASSQPASVSTNLRPQSNSTTTTTAVCSNPRCIAAAAAAGATTASSTTHCRHRVQGSPGDHLRTPTSIELAELAEVGAEAVFVSSSRNTATTTTSSSIGRRTADCSSGDPLLQSPTPPAGSPASNSSPTTTTTTTTHLMHHMHHHHMHHMLHHVRPPSEQQQQQLPGAPSNTVAVSVNNTVAVPDHRSSFQESMKALRKMGWYWGPLSFTEAEKLLANRPDGTFLVRDSAHDTFFLSLSFRVRGTTYHTRIEHNQGRFSFWFEQESHSASTVVEFIEKAVAHSIGGKFHYFLQTSTPGQQPVEVSLLYPLSRFQVVQSLRHLARFTVLSHVRRDHVARLPLPRSQINYLLEKQVYWESLEDFEEAIRDRPPLQFTPLSAAAASSSSSPPPPKS